MKKLILTCITVISFNQFLCAQTAQMDLDFNNVRTTITNANGIFWNGTNAKFEVPRVIPGQVAKSSIFMAAPWIGGISNGQLFLMAETYKQNGRDILPGSISTNTDSVALGYWDRLWKITKADIQDFRTKFQNGQDVSSYTNILGWPAKGNALTNDTSASYAPFVDANNNGNYEPWLGEYPLIKGDQCVYTIMNDDVTHTESNGQPLKIEIHRMAYEYATNDDLNNTVFVDYKIINKSNRTYDSLIFSQWVDFDLGNYNDDFIGTDSARNMIYAYNGDTLDEGILGYGLNPPAEGCVILNHKLWASMYYNNINGNTSSGNPTLPNHFFNYMQGKWMNGLVKKAAGSGYNTNGPATLYSFNGNPCTNTGWWEGSAGIQPGDRRILGSIAPQTLAPGQALDVTLAYIFYRGASGGNIGAVCGLKTVADYVQHWYDNTQTTGIKESPFTKQVFQLYPNPASEMVTITQPSQSIATARIWDITGKQLKQVSFNSSVSISTAEFKQGIYLVEVKTDDGISTQRLIIK